MVDMVLEEIDFGKMTISRGKKYEFLRIKLHFLNGGKVELNMSFYLRNAIDASGLEIRPHAVTAEKTDLNMADLRSPVLPT